MTDKNDPVHQKVDIFIGALNSKKDTELRYTHKSKLHAFLAGKNKYVGMKIGEAAKAGAWNWNSIHMQPYKELLERLDAHH